MNKKVMTFVVAMVLLLGVTLGVTFALMTDNTGAITNTFVVGGFGELDIWETVDDNLTKADTDIEGNTYDVFPGAEFVKDPYVTFVPTTTGATGKYYVFVKIEGEGWTFTDNSATYKIDATPDVNTDDVTVDLLTFDIVESYRENNVVKGWQPLMNGGDQVQGVYYQVFEETDGAYVEPNDDDIALGQIIEDDSVTVPATITADQTAGIAGNEIELSFSAYAIQDFKNDDGSTPSAYQAWTKVGTELGA